MITAVDNRQDRDVRSLSVCAVPLLAESMSLLIYKRETRGVESNLGKYLVRFKTEAPDNPTKHLLLEGEHDSVSPSNKR